jgi:hypothetical protein
LSSIVLVPSSSIGFPYREIEDDVAHNKYDWVIRRFALRRATVVFAANATESWSGREHSP